MEGLPNAGLTGTLAKILFNLTVFTQAIQTVAISADPDLAETIFDDGGGARAVQAGCRVAWQALDLAVVAADAADPGPESADPDMPAAIFIQAHDAVGAETFWPVGIMLQAEQTVVAGAVDLQAGVEGAYP